MEAFVAVDVETANFSRSSICQIGAVLIEGRTVTQTFSTLVDPETWFDEFNVAIHGITPETVRGQPKFPEIAAGVESFVGGRVVISHTTFDRSAFTQAFKRLSRRP